MNKNLIGFPYVCPQRLLGYVFEPRDPFAFLPALPHSDCLLYVIGVAESAGINSSVYVETHRRDVVICRVHWLEIYWQVATILRPG